MSRLELRQNLKQKLSPQQIQFMKLLQVSNANIESEIKKELEENPALEEIENNEKETIENNPTQKWCGNLIRHSD